MKSSWLANSYSSRNRTAYLFLIIVCFYFYILYFVQALSLLCNIILPCLGDEVFLKVLLLFTDYYYFQFHVIGLSTLVTFSYFIQEFFFVIFVVSIIVLILFRNLLILCVFFWIIYLLIQHSWLYFTTICAWFSYSVSCFFFSYAKRILPFLKSPC